MGSKRIKGITIEIDGKTSKLQSALKGVDSQLSKTQSALRDVNRLLKLDPKNTELLSQKQKLLADSVTATKDRLEALKQAEKNAQKAFAEGKITQQQYDALEREIAETEAKLKSLEKTAAQSSSGLIEFGNKATNVGEKLEGAGKAMMPVSAAATGIGIASTKMAVDFENSMAQINTLLSDTSDLNTYEDAVKKMSAETGMSLETVASGMYQTISSIGDGGDVTVAVFETMGIAAKAGGAEVSDSVALISAAMKGYNSVNDETAQKISDLAFQTAKLGVTTFPEMARSMQPLFPLANSLNISFEELFGTMATLTGVTGNTSEVSTQLKAVFSGLMKPTSAMTALMQEYGYANGAAMIESEGLEGVLRILQEATGGQADKLAELFGSTEALTAATALTGAQFDAFIEKTAAMQNATGATAEAYNKLQTNGQQMQITLNQLKITGMELGQTLLEMLAPVIQTVSELVHQFSEWFSGLDENQKKVIGTITLLVASIGPLLLIVGKAITTIGTVSTALGTLKTFLSGTSIAAGIAGKGILLFSGPLLPIAGIVAGVVAAGVLLWKNWDTIKEKAGQLGSAISEKWNSIKAKTSEVWESVKNAITKPVDRAKELVRSSIEKMKSFFNFKWELPKLKMPHISISGKFSLVPPSVPKFSISWYKKAMDQAFLLTRPTIFGQSGGNLLGGGEAGSEMVVGQGHLMRMINKASDSSIMTDICSDGFGQIVGLLQRYLPAMGNARIVLDTGAVVGELAPRIDIELANMKGLRGRGV